MNLKSLTEALNLTNIWNVLSTGSGIFKSQNLVYFQAQNENCPNGPFLTLHKSIENQGQNLALNLLIETFV